MSHPLWVPCPCCPEWQCTKHGMHAHDCECPSIEDMAFDPYATGGQPIKEDSMSITNVAFTIPGDPVGKGRPRATVRGKHVHFYTPEETAQYERLVAQHATAAMGPSPALDGPCVMQLELIYGVPPSWAKKNREAALAGIILPTVKPDVDNVMKAICDAINGVVWNDDVQLVEWAGTKRYGAEPCVRVRVAAL